MLEFPFIWLQNSNRKLFSFLFFCIQESFNLPSCQKVVKLPSIPWEEYTVSLSAMDRQRLSNPHHTRAAVTQNLAKGGTFLSSPLLSI